MAAWWTRRSTTATVIAWSGKIFGDVGEVVEDQQMEFVELGDGGFESQLAAGDLQALDEISRAGEQDAPAPVDEGEAKSRRQVAFSAAGRPEQQQIGALVKPGVAGGSAMTWALLTTGTASKSKVSRVLPGGSRALARWRSRRRRARSAISCSARAARKPPPASLPCRPGRRARPRPA